MSAEPKTAAAAHLVVRSGTNLLLVAALLLPSSLLWDFSWELTVGVDLFWSPPHTLTHTAVALAAVAVLLMLRPPPRCSSDSPPGNPRSRPGECPLGGWLVGWGALAFLTAVLFDRWWQGAYGLQAGIWHPPQMLKATAFLAILGGAWIVAARTRNAPGADSGWAAEAAFAAAGGCLLALIGIVTLTSSYPNQQHSASFYQLACATYPFVLAAAAAARRGRLRWPATVAALFYMAIITAMCWLLPRFAASPMTGPIYNPMDHLMPPPFPLLLVVPALAMDAALRIIRWPEGRSRFWAQAATLGLVFLGFFLAAQWPFASFLLSLGADNAFFAGGGRHWPFFLKISPEARVMFWRSPDDLMTLANAVKAAVFAVGSAGIGLGLGGWMSRLRR